MLRERAAKAKIQLDFIQLFFFLKTNQQKRSVRTFSGKRARRSEQHGADKQQTSRRLHLPRRSSTLVHNPAGEVSVPVRSPNVASRLPDLFIYLFKLFRSPGWFTGTSASARLFFQSVRLPPWNPEPAASKASERAGAEARSREGQSGEWQVESPPPTTSPYLSIFDSSIYILDLSTSMDTCVEKKKKKLVKVKVLIQLF